MNTWTLEPGRLLNPENRLVMADTEQEAKEMAPFIDAAYGKVLVLGLGLGLIVKRLLAKGRTEKIAVLEIEPEVIALVPMPDGVEIICGDAYTFDPGERRWDCIWMDLYGPEKVSLDRWKQYATHAVRWPYGDW